MLLALMLPSLCLIAIFSYLPAINAIKHSFYKWDGAFVKEFVGMGNFRMLLGDLTLWTPFLLSCLTLGLSGLSTSPTTRKRLKWLIVPAVIWTIFTISLDAVTNGFQGGTPKAGQAFYTFLGLALAVGSGMLLFKNKLKLQTVARVAFWLLSVSAGFVYLIGIKQTGDQLLWMSFRLIFIMVAANLLKMWPSIFTAICIHRLKSERFQYVYRVLFVIPMIIPQIVMLLIWKFFYDPNIGILNTVLTKLHIDRLLIWLDTWVFHLGVFTDPFNPAWLGNPHLIIPALVFWGFPWVGVVGVLIYLSGLQNIGNDVYEAAEIDGIGWWGKFWRIELPLIMTQVRLNLILMIVATFQAYSFQYILLGAEGGPQNRGLTPGLYMFYRAFMEQDYGYACAIGLILFVIILTLTAINQRFVKVDK
jgi:raffinose/stachyose/melibiose transport system permease protein